MISTDIFSINQKKKKKKLAFYFTAQQESCLCARLTLFQSESTRYSFPVWGITHNSLKFSWIFTVDAVHVGRHEEAKRRPQVARKYRSLQHRTRPRNERSSRTKIMDRGTMCCKQQDEKLEQNRWRREGIKGRGVGNKIPEARKLTASARRPAVAGTGYFLLTNRFDDI